MKRRNHTEYKICGVYGEEPRYTRTLQKARGVLASFGGGVVDKFRFTPSRICRCRCIPKTDSQKLTLRRYLMKSLREEGGWR